MDAQTEREKRIEGAFEFLGAVGAVLSGEAAVSARYRKDGKVEIVLWDSVYEMLVEAHDRASQKTLVPLRASDGEGMSSPVAAI